MNASAAVHGLLRIPHAGPAFRRSEAGGETASPCGREPPAEAIRKILRETGYTVTQLSAATGKRYGSRSPFFIPPTFLYKLRSGVTPHVCQVVALSESTGYRFVDWMRICGFDLHQIPRLQMRVHTERTVLITPLESDLASFRASPSTSLETARGSSPRLGTSDRSYRRRYLFAKIGSRDAQFYPLLPPGSVVRVDPYACRTRGSDNTSKDALLWLVEHAWGLTCSRVRWIDDQQIILLPHRPPWGSWPLRLPAEARILGLVDPEHRSVNQLRLPPVGGSECVQPAFPSYYGKQKIQFSDLLRTSRGRTGLTFRAAHQITCAIAQIMGNRGYAVGLGLLSDYEATTRLPRHIAKLISLCITYCIDVRELMEAAGVYIDDAAKIPLPAGDRLLPFRTDLRESTGPRRPISTAGKSSPYPMQPRSASPDAYRT